MISRASIDLDDGSETSSEERNDTDASSETDHSLSSSIGSTSTDHALSPSPPPSNDGATELSIDYKLSLTLIPIKDSPISEEAAIAKEEDFYKTERGKLKRRKLDWKLKRTKSTKVWHGFTKELSLFATNCIIKEKQIKKICHAEIKQFFCPNTTKSRHCSIIRNFAINDEKRLCDITMNIFRNSKQSKLIMDRENDNEYSDCFDIWNIGLIMLFMVYGKENAMDIVEKDTLKDLCSVQEFVWNLYLHNTISTNLFDLLYFFMFIFGENTNERQSRYKQIAHHLWFNK